MKQLTAAAFGMILALALVVSLAAAGAAADVSGSWNVEGDVVGNAVKFTCVLKQSGESLSGTATVEGKEQPMKGTVKDRVVSFEFDVDYQGSTYHNVYTGKVNDGNSAIDGKIEVAGVEGVFSMKKQ
jgi:hypothetical protein